jgi:hypothetical protein
MKLELRLFGIGIIVRYVAVNGDVDVDVSSSQNVVPDIGGVGTWMVAIVIGSVSPNRWVYFRFAIEVSKRK